MAATAALASLSVIIEENLSQQAEEKGAYIKEKFIKLGETSSIIKEVRGLGLLLGIELAVEAKPVQDFCLEEGLLINCVQNKVLRLVPPLNISYEDIDKALAIIGKALDVIK